MCGASIGENTLLDFYGDQVRTLGMPKEVWVELRDGTSVQMPALREEPGHQPQQHDFERVQPATGTDYKPGGPI